MANWGRIFSGLFQRKPAQATTGILSRPADPELFKKQLDLKLVREGMLPRQELPEVQLGRDWAKLRQLRPDLFRQRSDQAAQLGKQRTQLELDAAPLAPPGKQSATGKPFQKKGGMVGQVMGMFRKSMNPVRLAGNSLVPPLVGPGTVNFARDINTVRKGLPLPANKALPSLPLTRSALQNMLVPATTGIVADSVLPTDWKQKLWSDFKSLKPMPGR